MKKLILASASPRRRELLKQAGAEFEVIPARGEEHLIQGTPGALSYTHHRAHET